jgi:hypothetical protein
MLNLNYLLRSLFIIADGTVSRMLGPLAWSISQNLFVK